MSAINQMLVDKLGPLGPLIVLGGLGFLLILGVLPILMRKQADPMAKFRDQAKPQAGGKDAGAKKSLRHGGKGSDRLDKFATFLEPKTEEEMTTARMKMTRAGYRGRNAVRTFHAIQFTLGLVCLTIGVGYALFASMSEGISTTKLILSVLVPGGVGYYLPKYWVEKRITSRQGEIQNGFPDALDMLLVCVEAGQSLDQGIIRVSKELHAGYPALAEEFEIVSQEVKAGKEKTAVLPRRARKRPPCCAPSAIAPGCRTCRRS